MHSALFLFWRQGWLQAISIPLVHILYLELRTSSGTAPGWLRGRHRYISSGTESISSSGVAWSHEFHQSSVDPIDVRVYHLMITIVDDRDPDLSATGVSHFRYCKRNLYLSQFAKIYFTVKYKGEFNILKRLIGQIWVHSKCL